MNKPQRIILPLIFVIVLLHSASGLAREKEIPENQTRYLPAGFYGGGQASTNGLGLNIKYILSKRFTFKAGYETLKLNYAFNLNENDIQYDANLNYKTGGFFLLANWFYSPALYLSAGALANQFNPKMEGKAVSGLQYGDITIPASSVGDFNFQFEPELQVTPYFALGFRKFLGKAKRITYNFETGLYYMGSPQLEIQTTGLLSPTADPIHGQAQYLEEQFSAYKYYPVVKLDVAFRLF